MADQPLNPSESRATRRLTLAYIVAPLTTVPVLIALSILATTDRIPFRDFIAAVEYPLFFYSFFGLPIAYLVEFLVVVAVRVAGRNPASLRERWVVLSATTGGAIGPAVVFAFDGFTNAR